MTPINVAFMFSHSKKFYVACNILMLNMIWQFMLPTVDAQAIVDEQIENVKYSKMYKIKFFMLMKALLLI